MSGPVVGDYAVLPHRGDWQTAELYGPADELRGPQLLGPVTCDYAVLPHRGDWRSAGLHARAEEFLVPLIVEPVPSTSTAELAPTGRRLRVEGAVVSAVTRTGTDLTIRVFNPSPEPVALTVEIDGAPAHGTVVDLGDEVLDLFTGARDLRAGEIVTLRLP